ncbi:hypothetical protein KCTC32516_00782 [Polaribacter huanghezhanensis]|uniref:DUF5687 family protein n=1 Tax=Polaribacter huanghezhanensis TaxID=1354726 RepID=UPI0026485013|nr:DUF5687 family protein [Polaribacter huanghezhanensis]WKD85442.1 hypothetical protein KCTC32516_00782 [Polaribacter huanghezhanensis]
MFKRFLKLEWKQYFRSSYWQKGIALKIIMGFFALYMMVSFLALGVGSFFIIRKTMPGQDPFQVVNSFLLFAVIGDLIFRYLMQKLPVMNVKPLLVLPIKKNKLVHYVLGKSMFSAFNLFSLFFYIPFSVVLIKENYNTSGVLGWLFSMILITQSANFLNFIINKNTIALTVLGTLLIGTIALQYFNIYDVTVHSQAIFNGIYENPIYMLIPVALVAILYSVNQKILRKQLYLDDAVKVKVKEANTADLSWANRFGEMAPFIKNEIRLIWRNKRTKTVFLMSFLFVLYGLIFFTNPMYKEKMEGMLIFASLFVTGGFVLNYGQFIPAWESAYYKMLMTQNVSYRKYLESKWYLMVVVTAALFILATPYIYFGLNIYLMIAVGALYNMGINTLILIFAGAFNRKQIDLNASGFGNTQGTSAKQFIVVIPVMIIPIGLFYAFSLPFGFNAGIAAIAGFGILGLVTKNYFMNLIAKKYIKEKYAAIHAFDQKA